MSPFEQSVADAIEQARDALDHKVGLGTIRQVERDVLAMLIAAAIGPGGEERAKATIAATRASEAVHELLLFAREGNQMATTAYSISVVENLADAIRFAIDAQGGPEDREEERFLADIQRYLDPSKPLDDIYCPGVLRCAKCQFRLVKTTLNVANGQAYANNEPDHCPNCDVPMWRVTWQDEAKEAYAVAESQMDRAIEAERKLAASEAGAPKFEPEPDEEIPDEDIDPYLPEYVRGEKRNGIQRSHWVGGWFVPWSPRNDNENAEGPWSHWVKLARAIIVADEKARAALKERV